MARTKMSKSRYALGRWLQKTATSLQQLADDLGVSNPSVYYWKSGRTRPTHENAHLLEHVTKGAVRAAGWIEIPHADEAQQEAEVELAEQQSQELAERRHAYVALLQAVRRGP